MWIIGRQYLSRFIRIPPTSTADVVNQDIVIFWFLNISLSFAKASFDTSMRLRISALHVSNICYYFFPIVRFLYLFYFGVSNL